MSEAIPGLSDHCVRTLLQGNALPRQLALLVGELLGKAHRPEWPLHGSQFPGLVSTPGVQPVLTPLERETPSSTCGLVCVDHMQETQKLSCHVNRNQMLRSQITKSGLVIRGRR